MSESMKNIHSRTLWSSTKEEAGLVAAGCVLGGAVGVGGGYAVSQLTGAPLVPFLVLGGTVGVAVGGGVAVYGAHRIQEARAEASAYTDYALGQEIARIGGRPAPTKKPDIETMIESGMTGALKNAQIGRQLAAALDATLDVRFAALPTQLSNAWNRQCAVNDAAAADAAARPAAVADAAA